MANELHTYNDEEVLPFLFHQYEESGGNVLFAWQAMWICFTHRIPLPDWVQMYLAWASESLMTALSEPKPTDDHLARAVGLKNPHGKASPLSEYQRAERDWKLAFAVKQVLHEDETKYGKAKLTAACKKVAERHNVGWRTVERAYKEVMG